MVKGADRRCDLLMAHAVLDDRQGRTVTEQQAGVSMAGVVKSDALGSGSVSDPAEALGQTIRLQQVAIRPGTDLDPRREGDAVLGESCVLPLAFQPKCQGS